MIDIKKVRVMDVDEKYDVLVCNREGEPSIFLDNVTGVCVTCGHAVYHRPDVPPGFARKLCRQCALQEIAAIGGVELATTKKQLDVIKDYVEAQASIPAKKDLH